MRRNLTLALLTAALTVLTAAPALAGWSWS